MDQVEPHGPLTEIAPGIHCVDGEWGPLKRRMTVIVLKTGVLAIHSAVLINEEELQKLDALGPVTYILVPNVFHNTDAPWYSGRYPKAQVFVPERSIKSESKRMRVTGSLERNYPLSLNDELEAHSIDGIRFFETAFLHHRSKTLIVTDLVFNFEEGDFKGPLKFLMNLNKTGRGLGYTRVLKHIFLKDSTQFKESVDRVLKCDFQNLIMSHGHIIKQDAKLLLREVFPES